MLHLMYNLVHDTGIGRDAQLDQDPFGQLGANNPNFAFVCLVEELVETIHRY